MAATRPSITSRNATASQAAGERAEVKRERMIDSALEASFPASDPPSWTLGRIPPESKPASTSSSIDRSPGPATRPRRT